MSIATTRRARAASAPVSVPSPQPISSTSLSGPGSERVDDGIQHVAIDEEMLAEAGVATEPDAVGHCRERPGIGEVERLAGALGARVLSHAAMAVAAVAIPSTRWAVRVVTARTSATEALRAGVPPCRRDRPLAREVRLCPVRAPG